MNNTLNYKSTFFNLVKEYKRYFVQDRIISVKVGDFFLKINKKHALPYILSKVPTYSKNLPRLALLMHKKYPNLKLIDVGANIGDTVALVRSQVVIPILCIEGDAFFFSLLEKNWKNVNGVKTVNVFLSDSDEKILAKSESGLGTSRIKKVSDGHIFLKTLDSVLYEQKDFNDSKLIKIDTDGYDFKIMRGAIKYISEVKPVLFFELDRFLLEENHEDALQTLWKLNSLGYDRIFFYDNNGRFVLATSLAEKKIITQLYQYTYKKQAHIPYYDVAVFHCEDIDIANEFEVLEKNT